MVIFWKCNQCEFESSVRESVATHMALNPTHETSLKRLATSTADHITIPLADLEHLLNCMANKNFIHEQSPEIQKEWQDVYDQAWNHMMSLVSDHRHLKIPYEIVGTDKAQEGADQTMITVTTPLYKVGVPNQNNTVFGSSPFLAIIQTFHDLSPEKRAVLLMNIRSRLKGQTDEPK